MVRKFLAMIGISSVIIISVAISISYLHLEELRRQNNCALCMFQKRPTAAELAFVTSKGDVDEIRLPPEISPPSQTGKYGYGVFQGYSCKNSSGTFFSFPDDRKAMVSISLKPGARLSSFPPERSCYSHAKMISEGQSRLGMLIYSKLSDSFFALDKMMFPTDIGNFTITGTWTDNVFSGLITQK